MSIIKLISILCVMSIILGVVGVTIYMMRQRQQRHKPGLLQFARQLNFTVFESEAQIKPIFEQLNRFDFFQQGNAPRIRALAQGEYENKPVQVMILALTRSGVDQSFVDEYAAVCIHHQRPDLPDFKLQPQGYAIERALNTLLIGEEPQISLSDYPALSQHNQLTGNQPEAVHKLFAQGLGSYLNSLTEQSVYRSIESRETQFLYYAYQKSAVQENDLQQLYKESEQVLKLLEQATIS